MKPNKLWVYSDKILIDELRRRLINLSIGKTTCCQRDNCTCGRFKQVGRIKTFQGLFISIKNLLYDMGDF